MKGGPVPFSEISEIVEQTQYLIKESISPLLTPASSAPNNPTNSNVSPNVTKQFLRTEKKKASHVSPNIVKFFNIAFENSHKSSS